MERYRQKPPLGGKPNDQLTSVYATREGVCKLHWKFYNIGLLLYGQQVSEMARKIVVFDGPNKIVDKPFSSYGVIADDSVYQLQNGYDLHGNSTSIDKPQDIIPMPDKRTYVRTTQWQVLRYGFQATKNRPGFFWWDSQAGDQRTNKRVRMLNSKNQVLRTITDWTGTLYFTPVPAHHLVHIKLNDWYIIEITELGPGVRTSIVFNLQY